MSTFLIGLFVAIGVGGWAYSQLQRRTGGADSKTSLLFAAIAGVIAFILIFIIFGFIPD